MQIYDTAARAKVRLVPRDPADIRMYVCGPTVYDRIHLGNGRAAVVFDLMRRVLEEEYGAGTVRMVRNITDVDDKINTRAAERGVAIGEVTAETTAWFREDVAALGTLTPAAEPRATEHIAGMIAMIARILENGHAYVRNGHVFFDVASDPESGKLFRSEMVGLPSEDGGHGKADPQDFVLWKPSDAGQPAWPSPWGPGRPGWHIECSAMLREAFGPEGVDIHGGGADLQFPHHENEEAQHRCAHPHEPFARHWAHNGMVTVDNKKMSKSLGNFITIRETLDRGFGGDAIRLALLTAHYAGSLDWSENLITAADATARRWRALTAGVAPVADSEVVAALRDDLATPRALARLHALERAGDIAGLAHGVALLGLTDADRAPEVTVPADLRAAVEAIIRDRDAARAERRWADSDALRARAAEIGFALKDAKGGGTEWTYAPHPVKPPSDDPHITV